MISYGRVAAVAVVGNEGRRSPCIGRSLSGLERRRFHHPGKRRRLLSRACNGKDKLGRSEDHP